MLGGWGLVGAGILGVVAHVSGLVSSTLSRLASFTPVFVLGAMVGLVVLGAARRVYSAAVALVVVVAGIATQLPLFVGADEVVADSDLRVMQANIYLGQADTADLARTVADRRIDVLTVVELTRTPSAGSTAQVCVPGCRSSTSIRGTVAAAPASIRVSR